MKKEKKKKNMEKYVFFGLTRWEGDEDGEDEEYE